MEVDILNYSPTVMFRGTPSTKVRDITNIYYFIIFYGQSSWGRIKKI